jgi:hypothetical protein
MGERTERQGEMLISSVNLEEGLYEGTHVRGLIGINVEGESDDYISICSVSTPSFQMYRKRVPKMRALAAELKPSHLAGSNGRFGGLLVKFATIVHHISRKCRDSVSARTA